MHISNDQQSISVGHIPSIPHLVWWHNVHSPQHVFSSTSIMQTSIVSSKSQNVICVTPIFSHLGTNDLINYIVWHFMKWTHLPKYVSRNENIAIKFIWNLGMLHERMPRELNGCQEMPWDILVVNIFERLPT